jgi:anti-sigma factor RsiW
MARVPGGVSRLDHLRYRRYLDAFVDGELRGELSARVERHVTTCPMCLDSLDVTAHVKESLARRRRVRDRAARQLRRFTRRDPD